MRKTVKRRIRVFAIAVALVVIAVTGYHFYPKLNERRLLKNARNFVAAKNDQAAAISAARVLQINRGSVEATRILAEIYGRQKSPVVLTWKRRLVELEPQSVENRWSLAETALDLGKPAIAAQALGELPASAQTNARQHELAGRVAKALKDSAKAEVEFSKAVELEPTDIWYQFNLQSQRIESGDPAVQAAARTALIRLRAQPGLFVPISRVLIDDAMRRRDDARVIELSAALQKAPGATFEDHLSHLDLLRRSKSSLFAGYLSQLQDEAVNDPERIYSLLTWFNTSGSTLMAVDWSKRLPAKMLTRMPVPVALAQSYVALRDWKNVKPLVAGSAVEARGWKAVTNSDPDVDWGNSKFLRLAFLAAVLRDEGDLLKSAVQWTNAVNAAGTRPEAISALAHYAVEWGWETEATDLLWKMARGNSEQMWALRLLYRRYERLQSASNMLNVVTRMYELDASDRDTANNLAFLNLLLGKDIELGMKIAKGLYEADPANPNYVSTFAFAHLVNERAWEAVAVMNTLPEEQLEVPSIAAYYGVMLTSAQRAGEARKFLELGSRAQLLPEEKKLVDRAWEIVNASKPDAPQASAE